MNAFSIVAVFFTLSHAAVAQTCQNSLAEANRAYYNGQLQQVSQILEPCLNSTAFNKEDRVTALKLLVNTRLLQNQDEQADQYLQEFLTLDPTYELREDDLAEFKNLYQTYEIRTKYSFGFSVGMVQPDYIIMRHQSFSGQTVEPADFDEITGIALGFTGDYSIWKSLYVSASVLAAQRSFKQEEEILGYRKVRSHEKDFYIDLPIQLKYGIQIGKFKPYVAGGYALHFLIHSKGDIDHVGLTPDFPMITGVTEQAENFNLTDLRRRFTHNWVAGAGVVIDFGKSILDLRFNYEIGMNNQVKTDARLANRDLVERYAFIPDDYRVNSFNLSVVYSRNILTPYKRK